MGGVIALTGAMLLTASTLHAATQTHSLALQSASVGQLRATVTEPLRPYPLFYKLFDGHVTMTMGVNLTNLGATPVEVVLDLSVHHILTFEGLNVRDGIPEIDIQAAHGRATTQTLDQPRKNVEYHLRGHQTIPISIEFVITTCGYFQEDASVLAGDTRTFLVGGISQVLGACEGEGEPAPTSTETPRPEQPLPSAAADAPVPATGPAPARPTAAPTAGVLAVQGPSVTTAPASPAAAPNMSTPAVPVADPNTGADLDGDGVGIGLVLLLFGLALMARGGTSHREAEDGGFDVTGSR